MNFFIIEHIRISLLRVGELEDGGMKKMKLNFMSEEFKQTGTKHRFCSVLVTVWLTEHQTAVTVSSGARTAE